MENLKQLSLITVILLIIFYPFLILFSPIKVEIIPTKTDIQANIYKRTMRNPFNKVSVSNVKRAVTTTRKDSKGETKYRVELEDFKGNRFPVTSYEASGYNSEKSIENKINKAITNRKHFKQTITSHYLIMVILFSILILAYLLEQINRYRRRFRFLRS